MKRTDAEILLQNVKRICDRRGIPISRIEDKTGYARGHLRRMVTRERQVHIDHIRFYAQALGVPMVELMEGMLDE